MKAFVLASQDFSVFGCWSPTIESEELDVGHILSKLDVLIFGLESQFASMVEYEN
jgi:hypothetical protein